GSPGGGYPPPGSKRRRRPRRHGLPLAEARPGVAGGPGAGGARRLVEAGPSLASPSPRALAQGLPGVQGPGGGPKRRRGGRLLARRPLADLPLGELAPAGAEGLQGLRQPLLLVAQPQEHRVQRLRKEDSEEGVRDANFGTLTGAANRTEKRAG